MVDHVRAARAVAVACIFVLVAGCVSGAPDSMNAAPTTAAQPTTTRSPAEIADTAARLQAARDRLGPLLIDDGPLPDPAGYRREEWLTSWRDIDSDGCDAREQALVAASNPPAEVGPACKVISGSWRSAYDGMTASVPGDLDVDHVVPLQNAYVSGGDEWSTDQRVQFANDQRVLWVASPTSNRSKGSRAPNEWRPPDPDSWCDYARRWIDIKVTWRLTATTPERDALGQMLETCPV